ncbi:MAG: ABC transporter substrate-binding protein [Polaromonas sp.]|jgi:polar amino acid transport system substrate-binding protein|nr:ABC transporter substrate-binding protein [Polaromonas sp.]
MLNTLRSIFCPTGKLRAAINLGNPILAKLDVNQQPIGVSVDLAHELAKRLGVPLELLVVTGAAKSVAALNEQQADVGFFAIDPLRSAEIAFTAPYVLIEGCYLVRQDSLIQNNAQVDKVGNRIAVGTGSAYDLFLSREIKHAQLVREANVASVVEAFLEQGLEVAAGIKQALQSKAQANPKLRLLDGHFMVIEQAMGVPKKYGAEVADYVNAFVKEMKQSGFVSAAMNRYGVTGASVAP